MKHAYDCNATLMQQPAALYIIHMLCLLLYIPFSPHLFPMYTHLQHLPTIVGIYFIETLLHSRLID